VVALAGREFEGKVKNIGGTTGPPWDRRFEARISLDRAAPELRRSMTSNLVIASAATDLIVVDLNGDGKPDIVIANTANTTIAINTTGGAASQLTGARNGASFAVGQPLAPGSLASLFGVGMVPASVSAQATTIPLPANLGGLSLTVGGIPAPLLYVSSTQVNFQVPWTVPTGPADVVATVNGTRFPN
jgi:hypothetical protein